MPTQTRRSLVRADGPLPRSTLARRRDASETARTLRNTDRCAAQRNAEHPCANHIAIDVTNTNTNTTPQQTEQKCDTERTTSGTHLSQQQVDRAFARAPQNRASLLRTFAT